MGVVAGISELSLAKGLGFTMSDDGLYGDVAESPEEDEEDEQDPTDDDENPESFLPLLIPELELLLPPKDEFE